MLIATKTLDVVADLPFHPDNSDVRLAQTSQEIEWALEAAARSAVSLEVITDPKLAAEAYRQHAERVNSFYAANKIAYGVNPLLNEQRALQVTTEEVGGAVLRLCNPAGNGFDIFTAEFKSFGCL